MTTCTMTKNPTGIAEVLYRLQEKTSPDSAITLGKGEIKALRGDHRWRLILCHRGMLWITQANDPEDHVIKAGEAFLITKKGTVLIKSLRESTLEWSPSLKTSSFRGNLSYFP